MKKKIVVLGAGISGLATAWYLKEKYANRVELTVLEKSDRAGGWIETIEKEGFLFEMGPRSCRTRGTGFHSLQLIEQLGLQNEVVPASKKAAVKYLWAEQRLRKMPSNPLSFLLSPLTRKTVWPCLRELYRGSGLGEESVYDFFARRFSPYMAEQFADPMVNGIFAGDMRQLSVRAALPFLYQWEQEHGSVLRGAFARKKAAAYSSPFVKEMMGHALFSFKKGMETLPKTLFEKLKEHVVLDASVQAIRRVDGGLLIETKNGASVHADHCFSTLPAMALADLLQGHCSATASEARGIPHSSVAIINLGYKKPVLKLKGFGYLVPSKENEQILGVVWDSAVFPSHQAKGHTRLTVMVGGIKGASLLDYNDDTLTTIALNGISKHLGINTLPDAIHLRRATNAIPQYNVGHAGRVAAIQEGCQRISPLWTPSGTGLYGVSLNDCIATAKRLTSTISIK